MKKFTLQDKIEFVNKHEDIGYCAFGKEDNCSSCKTHIVELARKELGYSPATVDVDILQALMNVWALR